MEKIIKVNSGGREYPLREEIRKCSCWTEFNITDKDLEFLDMVSPVYKGIKYTIPAPTLCPKCRHQRRLAWRNERKLYKRTCDTTWKNIISVFSPDKPYPVYSSDEWWSDRWNPLDYGPADGIDFSRPFFEQMNELINIVPKLAIVNFNSENSDYTNISADNKDCYLIVESSNNENSFYSYWLQLSKDTIDSAYVNNSALCYECTSIDNSYNLKYCHRCMDCKDSYFLNDSEWCSYCFACQDLQWKKFHIFNKEVTEAEYIAFVDKFQNWTKEQKEDIAIKTAFFFESKWPREPRIKMSENCSWDYIIGSKDCIDVIDANDAENCRHSTDVWRNARDVMDGNTCGRNAAKCYEVTNCAVDVQNMLFCAMNWINQTDSTYCFYCANSSNLFWCVGLHSPHSYCILNKQYTKEEYEDLVPKIIEHMKKTWEWWEFFPASISPFGYNETVAMEYYPIERRDAINRVSTDGRTIFNWSDYENPKPDVSKIIPASKLPENIKDIPEDILNWAIECDRTKRPYRIIKAELDFYRRQSLPIPKLHPDERHIDRMKLRNPKKL
ncbi:MAG: hypothetical protein ACD_3C00123G0002 [uncultured bacterium (gcode 4)]|uniref:Caib/baif family protein n=1 Tax=uncultured bacterium (gcode 4) TaxID=1234023 RepID=K2F9X2_9BACT|nr:MAG: hypothetical protein ACD_3C00123G0002 [uncultured bacterium (gcode 4)]